jgi:hypothetical protein
MKYAPQEDNRKYDEEANNLIRTLSDERKYELYDIVLKKQKWSNSPTRDLELVAVAKAIKNTRGIDQYIQIHERREIMSTYLTICGAVIVINTVHVLITGSPLIFDLG